MAKCSLCVQGEETGVGCNRARSSQSEEHSPRRSSHFSGQHCCIAAASRHSPARSPAQMNISLPLSGTGRSNIARVGSMQRWTPTNINYQSRFQIVREKRKHATVFWEPTESLICWSIWDGGENTTANCCSLVWTTEKTEWENTLAFALYLTLWLLN